MLGIVAQTLRDSREPGHGCTAHREVHAYREVELPLAQPSRHAQHPEDAFMLTAFIIDHDFVHKGVHRRYVFRERYGKHDNRRLRPGLLQGPHHRRRQNHVTDEGKIDDEYLFRLQIHNQTSPPALHPVLKTRIIFSFTCSTEIPARHSSPFGQARFQQYLQSQSASMAFSSWP